METFKDQYKTEYIIIDKGNDEYTSMTKDLYDAQQAAIKPEK